MVDLYLHPCLLSLLGIFDLVVEEAQQSRLHGVWRHQELREPHLREWAVDEVEHLGHLFHDALARRHHEVVGIHLRVALVEVARADAGYVALGGRDEAQLGVNFQSLDTEDDVDALLLHALAPLDVALLVEACHEFHHRRHFLAVARCADECFHHLGVLGETVERGLDFLYARSQRRLAQHADVAVERVVRHVDETILLTDGVDDALLGEKLRLHHLRPARVFQLTVPAVGELHQVAMVLVPASGERRVEFLHVEPLQDFLLHLLWHVAVVDYTYR